MTRRDLLFVAICVAVAVLEWYWLFHSRIVDLWTLLPAVVCTLYYRWDRGCWPGQERP